jgi:hypothetical protein
MPVRKPSVRSGDEQWNLEISLVAARSILITLITPTLLGIRGTRPALTTQINRLIPRVVNGKMRTLAEPLARVMRNPPIPVGW